MEELKENELIIDDRELEEEKDMPLKELTEQERKELDKFLAKWESESDNTTL